MKRLIVPCLAFVAAIACNRDADDASPRASGYIEATEVRVAPEVGGRIVELLVEEGKRITAGDVIARLDTADAGPRRRTR